MSIEKIVAAAIDNNPLRLKEAFENEMNARIRVSLEEKYKKMMKKEEEIDGEDDTVSEEDGEDEEDEEEHLEESRKNYDASSPAHKMVRTIVTSYSRKMNPNFRAEYLPDGSAKIFTRGNTGNSVSGGGISSYDRVEYVHKNWGLSTGGVTHGRKASDYKNLTVRKHGLTFKTTEHVEFGIHGHVIHIS